MVFSSIKYYATEKNNTDQGGNRESSQERIYYGSTSNAYDIRYLDDCHQTYGRSYSNYNDKEDD